MNPLTDDERTIVEANLGLVHHVLNLQRCPTAERDDRFQDGVFGLMRAAQKHDPARGAFSTYAVGWIRRAIQQGRERFEGVNFRRDGAAYERPSPIPEAFDVADPHDPIADLLDELSADDGALAASLGLDDIDVACLTMKPSDAAHHVGRNRQWCTAHRDRVRARFAPIG